MTGEFHIHTTSSDGVLTVEEILKYVSGKRNYISITDHDILSSSIEAYRLNGKYDVHSIIGVEISSYYTVNDISETVHILGYFKNEDYLDIMKEFLQNLRNNRVLRLYKMKEKLKTLFDIELDLENILDRPSITRGTIAREIVAQGNPYTIDELFSKVIGNDCPAYIPATKVSSQVAIDIIHKAHGLAVLAHPVLLKKIDPKCIIELGCDGIEAVYPLNKENDEQKFRELAKEYGLFITGGPDFHSFNDSKHGDLLSCGIDGKDLEIFIKKVNDLK